MKLAWDSVLEYYSKNKEKIESEARAQLHRGTSARIIAEQHRTYLLARRYSQRRDVQIPFLDRLATRLTLIDRYQK